MSINVMLVSKQEDIRTRLRQQISDKEIQVTGEAEGGAAALERIENLAPDVLLLYFAQNDSDVLNLAERIVQYRPRTFVILVAQELDLPAMQAATRAGVHNVVEMPGDAKELRDYIRSVYNAEKLRLDSLEQGKRVAWTSKVITVFSAKGGLGKTTIATNLAVKLAEMQKKVALIDLDLQFGDAHVFLDIEPKDTIAELIQDVYTPNIDSLRAYMTVHSSGVHVLCAPKSPEYADAVSPDRVQSLLSLIRSYYDYVIIDTATNFNDVTMAAIEASSTILFVTGLDVSILKNSKLSMGILESLRQKEKVRVIINRAVQIHTISVADVQRIIDAPIFARIPSDYLTAVASLNRGVPFVQSVPNSKLSQAVSAMAEVLVTGKDNFDLQELSKKERRKMEKKFSATEVKPLRRFGRKK